MTTPRASLWNYITTFLIIRLWLTTTLGINYDYLMFYFRPIELDTIMHSSRLRTIRCSGHRGVSAKGCLPGGCLPRECVCVPGGACTGGCLPRWQWILGHTPPAQCMLGYTPPWTEFLTHTCENITFMQLHLRTVKIS